MEFYRVYVLLNKQARRYIGLTENLERRLQDHNAGVSKWTKSRGPWKLVWHSEPMSLSDARKLENQLKRQKGGRGLDHIIGATGS
ncbi:MAG: GIY-YIG nuclease family protein [Spartobacteria bacterium]